MNVVCMYAIATLRQPKLLLLGDTLEQPLALISGMEGHNLLAKHHGAAKDTDQYNYLKSNSTVYVALAMLPWSTAFGPEPAHIRPLCP